MISLREARALALGLPDATEQDHHDIGSFRVRGKIFATVPDAGHIRVMLDEDGIHSVIAEHAECCSPFYWGSRLACVVVDLELATSALVGELLVEAWSRKAPKALRDRFDFGSA